MSTATTAGDRSAKEIVRSDIETVAREMKNNGERITVEKLVGAAICHGEGYKLPGSVYYTAAAEYVEDRVRDDPDGLDVDHRAGLGREVCREPSRRRHKHYQRPRWATCHAENVDHMFVCPPCDGDDDEVRIDLDAVGGGMASTHDRGENLNLAVWLTREQARELGEDLVDNAETGAAQ